jgi:hypothetical protein
MEGHMTSAHIINTRATPLRKVYLAEPECTPSVRISALRLPMTAPLSEVVSHSCS